jgi:hypothetical protein
MARKLQIVISARPAEGLPLAPQKLSFWKKFKLLIAGVCMAVAAVAVLFAALVLGWIVAAVICLLVMIVVVAAVLRSTMWRARS